MRITKKELGNSSFELDHLALLINRSKRVVGLRTQAQQTRHRQSQKYHFRYHDEFLPPELSVQFTLLRMAKSCLTEP